MGQAVLELVSLFELGVKLNKIVFHFALHGVLEESHGDCLAIADANLAQRGANYSILGPTERLHVMLPLGPVHSEHLRLLRVLHHSVVERGTE